MSNSRALNWKKKAKEPILFESKTLPVYIRNLYTVYTRNNVCLLNNSVYIESEVKKKIIKQI